MHTNDANKKLIYPELSYILTGICFQINEDYYQLQRYLQISNIKLGLLVNFRNQYLKPIRVIKIDTAGKNRFV